MFCYTVQEICFIIAFYIDIFNVFLRIFSWCQKSILIFKNMAFNHIIFYFVLNFHWLILNDNHIIFSYLFKLFQSIFLYFFLCFWIFITYQFIFFFIWTVILSLSIIICYKSIRILRFSIMSIKMINESITTNDFSFIIIFR